ncbi:MAG: hypothetical protein IJS14_00600 [Lentisphaeria bacterium]|nr:hypothetical protein [Lentisphaeria bacterium]
MKKTVFTIGLQLAFLLIFAALPVRAQIAVRIEMSQQNYLQYEPVFVRVTLRNLSGHPLAFGENEGLRGMLRFEIHSDSGRYALLLGKETPPLKGVILQPGAARAITFNAARFYDVRRLEHYSIKAVISHPQLKSAYESDPATFSVVQGREVWQSVVGVPRYLLQKDNVQIPTRRYRLVSYNTGKRFVYVLLIEDKDRIYLIRRVGLDLGMDLAPQCAVDDLSRLNILIPASPKVYAYFQFDVTGKLEKREVRVKSDSRPRLVVNRDTGTVVLSGGRLARRDLDYEEIKELPFVSQAMNDAPKDITRGKSIIDEKDDD